MAGWFPQLIFKTDKKVLIPVDILTFCFFRDNFTGALQLEFFQPVDEDMAGNF